MSFGGAFVKLLLSYYLIDPRHPSCFIILSNGNSISVVATFVQVYNQSNGVKTCKPNLACYKADHVLSCPIYSARSNKRLVSLDTLCGKRIE
jgi:hypothetical protein